jgi:hypothetical protein
MHRFDRIGPLALQGTLPMPRGVFQQEPYPTQTLIGSD